MTYEKALERINMLLKHAAYLDYDDRDSEFNQTVAVHMACKSALEKQIPERPDLEGDGYWDGELVYDTGYCPRCHYDYEIEYHTPKYCWHCGQALDWSELHV